MISDRDEGEVIAAIERTIQERQPRNEGGETRFLCPAHEDHDPSARWNSRKRVWHCDVCGKGGGYLDLAKRLGIHLPERNGLSVAELAAAKGLSEKFLRELGVSDGTVGQHRTACVDIPYADGNGEIVAVRKRLNLTGDNRFIWRRGDHPLPYGLAVLPEARDRANYLVIVEGESDQWVCRRAGVPAIGIPGASVMKVQWGTYFEGIANVFVWQEPGSGGITFVEKVAAAVSVVRVIMAPPDAKDPADLWLLCHRDTDEFLSRMSALAHAAPYASALKADTSRQDAHDAFALAAPLLQNPALLASVAGAIRALGYAGGVNPPMIVYLALTSRLLRRPLNLGLIGPSAAGKNRAVDAALDLMPPSAYYVEKAGSARALVYNDESFEHRTVVVAEADSIPEDGPAASAIRALAADNEMTYDTVEKGADGRFVVRHVVKPGPTGLITTSTRPLPHQFDTRTLTVTVADTPGQTRDVMRAHAATVNGLHEKPSVDDFIALQRWLEVQGGRDVTIPYAATLAELVPADHVRMRRDFRQLLTMIEGMAVLHQCQRERDADGRIVATLEDYGHTRTLLRDVFQVAASGGVTPEVRQTVVAVHRIYDDKPLTKQAIADALGLSKDTAWYRIKRAISLGYLANEETGKGRPAKIRPADALPDDRPALPTVEELEARVSDRPITDSTIQPSDPNEPWLEPELGVEPAVECAIQPRLQPLLETVAASFSQTGEARVERLNFEPEGEHTRGTLDPSEEWEDIRV